LRHAVVGNDDGVRTVLGNDANGFSVVPENRCAIVDQSAGAIDAAWNEEWEKSTFDAALAHVRAVVNPRHYQVFDYCVLKEWPAAKVAATLNLNAAQVYLAKHRVAQAMKRAVRRINDERSNGMMNT